MEHTLARRTAGTPRTWSLCMTSENHGTVGPAGCTFSHAPEKHERVLVVEAPAGGHAPVAEFKGYVDGQPAVTWFDRDNMPRVGTKLFAGAAPAINVPTDERAKAFGEALSAIAGVLWEFENNNIGMENEVYGAERCQEAVRAAFGKTLVAAQAGQVSVPSQSWEAIGPLPVDRDENGWWSHPAIPNFEDDVDSYLGWVKAIGLEMKYKALESDPDHPLYDAWFEEGECNASSWAPEEPTGDGWFTFSIHDSEDGPIWAWARRADRAAVQASTSGERQEGGAA